MTRDIVTIDPAAPIGTALAVMATHRVRHLPVVDDGERLVGIVTDRDLRGAAFAPALEEHLSVEARRRLHGVTATVGGVRVRDAMTTAPVTIEPDAPVARAAARMLEGGFSSLPVVEGGVLVGIVTERDALRALAATEPPVPGVDPAMLW
jgi:CBS domain-containing protein